VTEARMMYQHYATLNWGLARGRRRGFWEKRAEERLNSGSFVNGQLESKIFGLYNKVRRKILRPDDLPRSWVDPGHKTGTAGNERSGATKAMTDATKG
jgi:hypothetical protein